MRNRLFMGMIVGAGFLLQGCMLMHLTGDHHSGMMGHGAENHDAEMMKSEQHAAQHQALRLPDDRLRKDVQGGIAIEIRFERIGDKGELAFQVRITDHPFYSELYKLDETAFLINDQGSEVPASRWGPSSPDRQHVTGKIYFPGQDPAGKAMLGPATGKIIVKIKNLGGIPERVFEWVLVSGN